MASWLQSQAHASRYPRDSVQQSQEQPLAENQTPPSARRSAAALRASEAMFGSYFPEASPTARSDRAFRCAGCAQGGWGPGGSGGAVGRCGRAPRVSTSLQQQPRAARDCFHCFPANGVKPGTCCV